MTVIYHVCESLDNQPDLVRLGEMDEDATEVKEYTLSVEFHRAKFTRKLPGVDPKLFCNVKVINSADVQSSSSAEAETGGNRNDSATPDTAVTDGNAGGTPPAPPVHHHSAIIGHTITPMIHIHNGTEGSFQVSFIYKIVNIVRYFNVN